MVREQKRIYRILSKSEKQEVYRLLQRNSSYGALEKISKRFNTSVKNLKRWQAHGIERKPGCGRKKLNVVAEQQLKQWALKRSLKLRRRVKRCEIQRQALILFKNPEFKASKAWQDEFVKSHNLKQQINYLLFDHGFLNLYQRKKFINKILKSETKIQIQEEEIETEQSYVSLEESSLETEKSVETAMEYIHTRSYYKNRKLDLWDPSVYTKMIKSVQTKDLSDDEESCDSTPLSVEQRYEYEDSIEQPYVVVCEDSDRVYQYLNLSHNSEQLNVKEL